jgi:hypothetical protein
VDIGPSATHLLQCEPVGARLYYRLAEYSSEEFVKGTVSRAHLVEDVYPSIILVPSIIDFIFHPRDQVQNVLPVLPELADMIMNKKEHYEALDIASRSASLHQRFIKEMAIEFNQTVRGDELTRKYLNKDLSMQEIIEDLKSEFHSSWRNSRDFEWIASLSDFDEVYIDAEYAKLDLVQPIM